MLLRMCVRRGARWLDRYDPTWHQRVNPEALANTDKQCVLGQAFGDASDFAIVRYRVAFLERVYSKKEFAIKSPLVAAMIWFFLSNGFSPTRDPESVWKRLWQDEIMKRQVGTAAGIEIPSFEIFPDRQKVNS